MNELPLATREVVETAKVLIVTISKLLVDDSERLRGEITADEGKLVLMLIVPEKDMKWLIGRDGRTAQALRTLTSALTAPLKPRLALQIRSDAAHTRGVGGLRGHSDWAPPD